MTDSPTRLSAAIDTHSAQFSRYDWTYHDFPTDDGRTEKIFYWFGSSEEEVMVCVLKQDTINEQFHHHGFFFINYAYRGSYDAVSYRFDTQGNQNRERVSDFPLCQVAPATWIP